MKLEAGQVAVITGAASGIGKGLADAFAARGLTVMLSDVGEEALENARADISGKGGKVAVKRADVSKAEDVTALRDEALHAFGRVDLICNNAGISTAAHAIWEFKLEEWRKLLDVNLQGVIHGLHAFVPLLVEQGSGHVLNTASMAGVTTIAYNGPYNASKHAVVALTEGLRLEFDDIAPALGATVLCPGLVRTNIGQGASSAKKDGRPERKPHGGDPGTTIDVAACARMTLGAIEANALHVFTNPGSERMVRERADRLMLDWPGVSESVSEAG